MTLHNDLQFLIDKEAAKPKTHSVLLAVQSGDGQIDFRGGAGAAAQAPFYIASVTKMFTATLILRLKDRGLLDLDMTAQSILTDYDLSDVHTVKGTPFGPTLTIRHLLQQTSGLSDYYEGKLAAELKRGEDREYDVSDVLRWARALPPQAPPDSGKSYYSDTNFQLLGAIIEKVTGQPLEQVLQQEICAPLGLAHTYISDVNQTQAPLRLYHKEMPLQLPSALASMGPDGGIISTLDDVLIFVRAYMSSNLFNPQNEGSARAFQKLYFPFQYGFGLMRFKLPVWLNLFRETPELIGHSGASGSFAFYAPQDDIFLVGTFNQTDAPKRPFALMMRVLRMLKDHRS